MHGAHGAQGGHQTAASQQCPYNVVMGVDHGGDREDMSPRIWSNANCPPQILSYKYKNERFVAFKIRQNPFSAGASPQTPLGELTTLLQTP